MISEQMISTIDSQLSWREAELALAKIYLQRAIGDERQFRYNYRCFVAITYAHYEAFTKQVIAQGMQDIFATGEKWSAFSLAIKSNLFASNLRLSLKQLSNQDLAIRCSSASSLIDDAEAPSLDMILECGNLNVMNFFWAIECIGLDPAKFNFARSDVGHLTALRHDCAHGEILTFNPTKTRFEIAQEMYSLQSRVIILMHTLAVELIDHFNYKLYLL